MLLLDAVTRRGCDSPPPAVMSESDTVCSGASSSIVRSPGCVSVGASLTGLTVTVNVRLTTALSAVVDRSPSSPPSSTVTVIRASPLRLLAGVRRMEPVASADV